MLDLPLTEKTNPHSCQLDQMPITEIVRLMNAEDQTVVAAVDQAQQAIVNALEAIVKAMLDGGRLFYVGAGTSGRLGILDAAECPPTFGVDPGLVTGIIAGGDPALRTSSEGAEDNPQTGAEIIRQNIAPKDVVVGLSASGRAPFVLGAIREAREIGAVTVGISCTTANALSAGVHFPIEILVGPEIIAGSTRLKAGTAQKLVLNMISTIAMIKLGKVFGNLMVNVQATNTKLQQRVHRIIEQVCGVDRQNAVELSQKAKGDARVAILIHQFGLSETAARQILHDHHEHFGQALRFCEKQMG